MRFALLQQDGTVENVILGDADWVEANAPGAVPVGPDVGPGWRRVGDQFVPPDPPPPTVPDRVTARQAVEALLRSGITEDMVEAALSAIPDATQRAIARNLWRRSNDFERNNPTLIALATQSLGMTEQQLDQLFILANTL
jgi:hypothetical protein